MIKLLLALTILAFSCTSFAKKCQDDSRYPDVSLIEMKKLVKEGKATIIDVNSAKSFKQARIPGAIHFGSNKGNLKSKLPADKGSMIVTYCGGKMCTAWKRAARASCDLGYNNVRHFSEGIKGWVEAEKASKAKKG